MDKAIKRHNEYCDKVRILSRDDTVNTDCIDSMVAGNVETGMKYCRLLNNNGEDFVVDVVWGYVLERRSVCMDEMIYGCEPAKRYIAEV